VDIRYGWEISQIPLFNYRGGKRVREVRGVIGAVDLFIR